jgi:hypothetical protein
MEAGMSQWGFSTLGALSRLTKIQSLRKNLNLNFEILEENVCFN